jgi:hypothetical protein
LLKEGMYMKNILIAREIEIDEEGNLINRAETPLDADPEEAGAA